MPKVSKKKLEAIAQLLGGYDDGVVSELVKNLKDIDLEDRRVSQAEAAVDVAQQLITAEAANSIAKQTQSYQDRLEIAKDMKDKIREVADMNTMGNVKLGLGEAWYQGKGDDDFICCKHCGGKLKVKKIKKKLFKRKARRNQAKGKPVPKAPKFMRSVIRKKPGPKKGGAKSEKQSEWMKYCKAVAKLDKMKGRPWQDVMKKASKLRKKGVTLDQIKSA